MDLVNPIIILSKMRRVFYSEADFQFALAWEIQKEFPTAKVRLEYCPACIDSKQHIDILVITESGWYPIELKYKTRAFFTNCDDEVYKLKNQSAQDQGRYDFLKDVQRIEILCKSLPQVRAGYAVFLTNDSSYWNESKRNDTVYSEFKLNDGLIKTGTMNWALHASEGTIDGRESPIILEKTYMLHWLNYCEIDKSRYGTFKYLLLSNQL